LASTTTERPARRLRRPDADAAAEQYRPSSRLTWRVGILGFALLAVFAALFLRLWALQVLSGPKYVNQAQANSFRLLRQPAPRGLLLDRTGIPLVTNVPTTAIELWPSDLPRIYNDRYAELARLAKVARVPLYEIARGIKARKNGNDLVTPVTVRENASGPMQKYLAERASQFPGVTMNRSWIRHYPYQGLAAQALGYVGAITESELKRLGKSYDLNDQIGQSGAESTYDTYLRGVAGASKLHVDNFGRPLGTAQPTTLPKPGNSVRLTLSLKLQEAAEKALQYGIGLAQSNGEWAARGGAIVALDPRDGSILAMASSPSYKPSVYAGHVTRNELAAQGLTTKTASSQNYPALNRATDATYPPGSVFKPVTALAAMQEHLIAPYENLSCTGTYQSPNDRSHHTFHNWDPNVNQAMDLPTALAYSCDTYFYQLGDDFYSLPANRGQPLQKWARIFGFGRLTGSDVGPEVPGLVPTIGWRRQNFSQQRDPCCWQVDELWKPGNSIQLAIGQGDLLVTPLQMALFYALIANGGYLVTPHLLDEVQTSTGSPVQTPQLPSPRQVPVDPAALAIVRQGLLEGTHATFGTSYPVFGQFPVSIAGKTGTAEKLITLPGYTGLKSQSWWCGYGPTEDAKLVVCAVIENGGHGGTAAAPAAAQVFGSFFHVHVKQATSTHSD
jgi:penicillin-binding protein 2